MRHRNTANTRSQASGLADPGVILAVLAGLRRESLGNRADAPRPPWLLFAARTCISPASTPPRPPRPGSPPPPGAADPVPGIGRPFQGRPVPPAKLGRRLIRALQEFEEHLVGRV